MEYPSVWLCSSRVTAETQYYLQELWSVQDHVIIQHLSSPKHARLTECYCTNTHLLGLTHCVVRV